MFPQNIYCSIIRYINIKSDFSHVWRICIKKGNICSLLRRTFFRKVSYNKFLSNRNKEDNIQDQKNGSTAADQSHLVPF